MSDIDNLNFKLILDDAKFNATVSSAIETARTLNTEVSKVLNFTNAANKAARESTRARIDEAKAIAAEEKALQSMAREQQKTLQATEKTKLAQQKVATEAAKAAKEQGKAAKEANKAAVEQQKAANLAAKGSADAQAAATKQLILEERLAQARQRTTEMLNRQTEELDKQEPILAKLAELAGAYISANGIKTFVQRMVDITGEFEKQRMALRNIVQDARGADKVFKQLTELAVESPFTMLDLTGYAKQLTAFSIPMDELYDTTKMLADVSAGLGVSMDRIILAYGQVRAATFLRGQEVRQFTEAGIPILEELAKQFSEIEGRTVEAAEVFERISKRDVPFEMVKQAFVDMTSAGGKFYNMQEVLASTISGKIEKIKDTAQIMLNEVGSANSGLIHGVLDTVIKLLRHYESWGKVLLSLIVTIKSFQGIYLVWNELVKKNGIIMQANAVATQFMTKSAAAGRLGLTGFTKAWVVLTRAMKTTQGVIGLVSLALGGIVAMIPLLKKQQEEVNLTTDETVDKYNKEIRLLDELHVKLKSTALSESERLKVIGQYNSAFADYNQKMITEKSTVQELDSSYKALSTSIRKAYVERMTTAMTANPDKTFNTATTALEDLVRNLSKKYNKPDILVDLDRWMNDSKATAESLAETLIQALGIESKTQETPSFNSSEFESVKTTPTDKNIDNIKDLTREYINARDASNDAHKAADDFAKKYNDANPVDQYVESLNLPNTINKIKELEEEQKKWTSIAANGAQNNEKALKELIVNTFGEEDSKKIFAKVAENQKVTLDFVNAELDNVDKEREKWEKHYNKLSGKTWKTALGTTTDKDVEKDVKKRIKAYEDEAKALSSLKAAYDMIDGLGIDTDSVFSAYGIDTSKLKDYEASIRNIADAIEAVGTAEAKASAQGLRDSIAKGELTKFKEAYEAFDKYAKAVEQWTAKDLDVEGQGVARKIEKIISNANTKNNKVDLDMAELKKQLTTFNNLASESEKEVLKDIIVKKWGEDFWDKWKTLGFDAIDGLGIRLKKQNENEAQEAINQLADDYTKKILSQYDLSDWGDKTASQIKELIKALQDELSQDLPEELKKRILEAGYSLEEFKKTVEEILQTKLGETSTEWFKKMKKSIDEVSKSLSTLGSSIKDLGDAMESSKVSMIGSALSSLGSFGSSLSSVFGDTIKNFDFKDIKGSLGELKVDKWAAASTAVQKTAEVIGIYTNQLKENKQAVKDWESAVQESLQKARLARIADYDYQESNIFGVDNPYAKAIAGVKKYNAALDELKGIANELGSGKVTMKLKDAISGENVAKGIGAGAAAGLAGTAAVGAAIGTVVGPIGTAIGAAVGAIVGGIVGLASTKKKKVTQTLQERYGWLYNEETYELNQEIINDYSKMDDETKKIIDNWDGIRDKMREADEALDETLTDLVGSLSDDLSQILKDAFVNDTVDGAIDDLHAKVSELLYDLAHDTAFALAFQDIFDELTERMRASFKGENADNDISDDLMWFDEQLDGSLEKYGMLTDAIRESLEKAGYTVDQFNDASSSGNTLSDSIKGITENTASLLASYVNAIRSDVSSMYMVQSQNGDLQREFFSTQAPTLADHLAQIQANTYNNAVDTQQILLELQSVMGPGDEGRAIRVVS